MHFHTSITLAFALGLAAIAPARAEAQANPPERAPASCEYGAPHSDAPEQLQQFGFLIGDFEITSHIMTPTGWSPPRPGPRARWNGYYGMGGMMIVDEWFDPDPGLQPDSPRGINVRHFDEDSGEWKMMWISTTGAQVQDLRAQVIDGVLRMWQVYPTEIERVADFFVEDDDTWHRISYVEDETGEWVPRFKLRATRIACDER